MKNSNFLILILLLILTIGACKKDNLENSNSLPNFSKNELSGYSQKGPFVNGSSLTLFELNSSYAQTGKVFNTQILDNTGLFELSNLSLLTSFTKLKADGFYFNEVSNKVSQSQLTLYAITDLSVNNSVNVNLMTTLEVARIEYLLSTGLDFGTAKTQAQSEVMRIFSITRPNISESELLNISQDGDDNAILLAISIILQGYRTEAELTQLLGDISTDIRSDGILNSQQNGSALINDVRLMNLSNIRNNITNKYLSLGITATIPPFEQYIQQFIDSTTYTFNNFITYPRIVNSKENQLYDSTFVPASNVWHSLGAFLPIGTALKLVVKPTSGNWTAGTGFLYQQNIGWTYSMYYPDSIVLQANGVNQTLDMPFIWGPPSSFDFILYENNATSPTRSITIHN
jgi:hypothetical protein